MSTKDETVTGQEIHEGSERCFKERGGLLDQATGEVYQQREGMNNEREI